MHSSAVYSGADNNNLDPKLMCKCQGKPQQRARVHSHGGMNKQ